MTATVLDAPRATTLLLGSGCFLTLGLRDGTLGVVWPSMRAGFGQPLSALGVLVIAGTIGYLVAASLSGRLTRLVGLGVVLVGGSILVCVALATYASVRSWDVLVIATSLLIGGAGFIDVGVNAHTVRTGTVRDLGILHSAYGVGTLVGPLVATAVLLSGISWRWAYAVLLIVELPLFAGLFRSRHAWSVPARPIHEAETQPQSPHESRRSLALALVLFFIYTGTEIGAGQWAFSSLTGGRNMATAAAGTAVSGYFGGLLAGRLLVAAVGARVGAPRLVTVGLSTALAGAALFALWPGPILGCAGLALAGLGLAPVFPALVALSPAATEGETAQTVGLRFAAGALGACILPSAAGLLLEHVALVALGPALLGAVAVLTVLQIPLSRPVSA